MGYCTASPQKRLVQVGRDDGWHRGGRDNEWHGGMVVTGGTRTTEGTGGVGGTGELPTVDTGLTAGHLAAKNWF